MAREFYKPEVKAAILKAVSDARAAGKKLDEQHKAAKSAGYKGGPGALQVLISKAGIAKKRGRKAAAPVAAAAPASGRKRGRRPGVKSPAGLTEVERLVQAEVANRVNAALAEAVKALQALKK